MKYTDLHMHLDGSLSVENVLKLADIQEIKLPTRDRDKLLGLLRAPASCTNLNTYLERFELPLLLLQSPEAITLSVYDIAKKMSEADIEYAELRFAPQLHTRLGLSQYEVVKTAVAACKSLPESLGTSIRLILCMMRGDSNHKENLETIEVAGSFDREIVAGIDLAGAEGLYPTDNFEDLFVRARALGLPFTIHAGEAAGPKSILKAIEFGARRIGHGITAIEDKELLKYLAQSDIAIEMCPSSNLQTKACSSLSEYPLRTYLELGIKATINSDNMTVSDTNVKKEFELLRNEYSLTDSEFNQLMTNARTAHL